jgi:hypothetical protein
MSGKWDTFPGWKSGGRGHRYGIALSKIHHAAFDNHLIGIDPNGRVHVSERLLALHDGPLLEQSLKACAGALIRAPRAAVWSRPRPPRGPVRAVQADRVTSGSILPRAIDCTGTSPRVDEQVGRKGSERDPHCRQGRYSPRGIPWASGAGFLSALASSSSSNRTAPGA